MRYFQINPINYFNTDEEKKNVPNINMIFSRFSLIIPQEKKLRNR